MAKDNKEFYGRTKSQGENNYSDEEKYSLVLEYENRGSSSQYYLNTQRYDKNIGFSDVRLKKKRIVIILKSGRNASVNLHAKLLQPILHYFWVYHTKILIV
ncbi:unnamed protein product [Rhizophagus irregularis]|nr:unnamed protein product [Rhizophagus irregularis]